ncbi:MAG: LacI family DNA-binding transcriptional regulator [Azospirillaceae bacterium]
MPDSDSLTLQDVAREAGVSLATVDRAINGRPGISARAKARVEAAMQRLNYAPNVYASRLARARLRRLAVILPHGHNPVMLSLAEEAERIARTLARERARIEIVHTDVFDPTSLAETIARVARRVDGLAVIALDHPSVHEAINNAVAAGKVVATLVSDAPRSARQHYVGIDNVAAGRTAAFTLGRFLGPAPGTVAVVAGTLQLRDHAERHLGFTQVMRDEFPNLEILAPLEGQDDPRTAGRLLHDLLAARPGITGLYNIGAGTEGLLETLRATGRGRDIVFVAHDLTVWTRPALIDGTVDAVIHQDPGHEMRSAVRRLLAALDRTPVSEGQERIRIDVYVKYNLP